MATSNSIRVILIGIAGPSGCGKTTYANHLVNHLHSPLNLIELDHFFVRQVSVDHPILGRVQSEEEPETLNIEGLSTLLHQIKTTPERSTRYHRSTADVCQWNNKSICVIVEGFLLFALSDQITNLFDIRIFLESNQSQCRLQRYRRDRSIPSAIANEQINIPTSYQNWFDHLVWDTYLKRCDLQRAKSDKIFHSDEYHHRHFIQLDQYIEKRLEEIRRR